MRCKACGLKGGLFSLKRGLCKSCRKSGATPASEGIEGFRTEMNQRVAARVTGYQVFVRSAVAEIQGRHPMVARAIIGQVEGTYHHSNSEQLAGMLIEMCDKGTSPKEAGRALLHALDHGG